MWHKLTLFFLLNSAFFLLVIIAFYHNKDLLVLGNNRYKTLPFIETCMKCDSYQLKRRKNELIVVQKIIP